MATKKQTPTTLEGIGETLHVLVETVAQVKEDVTDTRQRMGGLEERLGKTEHLQKEMLEELTATHGDARYVRATMTMLAHTDAAHEAAIESLNTRMARVEKKVGLAP